jgi:hypothetical protein
MTVSSGWSADGRLVERAAARDDLAYAVDAVGT